MSHNFAMAVDSVQLLEALQSLVRVGASDHLLGEAVREFLSPGAQGTRRPPAPRPAQPAQEANPPLSFPDPADIGAPGIVPSQSPPPYSPAATAPAYPKAPSPPPPASKPKLPEQTKAEIVVFKDQSGKRSSVSISPADWERLLVYASGDVSRARGLVRAAAAQAPQDVNRSQWVVSTILSSNLA